MRNSLTLRRSALQLCSGKSWSWHRWQLLFSLTLGLAAWWGGGLNPASSWADSPETAPPQLKEALTQIDAAANSKNVQAVLQFYGQNFTNSDGLTRQTLEQALTQLWKTYPNLKYQTELTSWQADGKEVLAETVTHITGTQPADGRDLKFDATLKTQQRFENQKIVRQDVLSERIQMTAGTNPPTVKFNLPEQVKPGQEYSLDAIVQEPLGNDLLMGTAIEEPVRTGGYLKPTPVDLEVLPAGGIFKVGRAAAVTDNRWVSTVLVRGDGMTVITQRLRVTGQIKPAAGKP